MFNQLSIALLASTLLIGSIEVQAQERDQYGTYVGCAKTSFTPTDAFKPEGKFSLSEDCAQECYYNENKQYMWSYYLWGTGECMCSDIFYPSQFEVAMPEEYSQTLRCADTDYDVWVSASTWSTQACYSLQEDPENEISGLTEIGVVANPEICFQACTDYSMSSYQLKGDADGATMYCWCGPQSAYSNKYRAACDYNIYAVFEHIQSTVVNSVFAKRQMKERLIKEINGKRKALCPGSLTACNVDEFRDSFECIDTTQELESCGGCSLGQFNQNPNLNATVGVDCTSLPGIPRGAVTCSDSKCTAFACKKGWTLTLDGHCVKA
ncbi:uncharacterized protein L201_006372 [Kwoniella dendrophila CBS 6074]|uniref:Protein CPL1-like domain-containing protein n=1 Tax=Kwoniella dendrophila CBS 6074 TaxID=1295534 RepID=A0AAX4K121_9TREE